MINISAIVPGRIVVVGDGITGINAGHGTDVTPFTGQGTIIIDATADIQSTGAIFVQGISGFMNGDGTVTIASDGDITTTASEPNALGAATAEDGQMRIENNGDITTNGLGANGIFGAQNGNVVVVISQAVSLLETGTTIRLGDDNRYTHAGTLSTFGRGTLGVTSLTVDVVMEETSTFELDLSDIGSGPRSVDGFAFINGTSDAIATTAPGSFAKGMCSWSWMPRTVSPACLTRSRTT